MSAFAYLFILLAGTSLLSVRKFQVNIWWIAFYASSIYGLPVVFGRDIFGQSISPEAGAIVLLTQLAIFAIAWFRKEPSTKLAENVGSNGALALVASFACIASFVLLLVLYGQAVFFVHKADSGVDGYVYILWRMSATFALIISVLESRYKLALVSLIPLLATLFAGDRTAVGLAAISLLWVLLQTKKVSGSRLGFVLACTGILALFLFFGKTFQALWAGGELGSISDLTVAILDDGTEAITKTEPFVVMGVFSALTKLQATPPGFLLLDVGAQFLVVPSFFGVDSGSFNDFFQPILFPGFKDKSLAYSFWGEAFVRGGWLGTAGFFAVYCGGLAWFDKMSRKQSLSFRSFAYVGGAYWAFYIHRNSMVSMVAYERQIVVFLFALIFATALVKLINRRLFP